MNRTTVHHACVITWIVVCCGVAAWWILAAGTADETLRGERMLLAAIVMVILTFPIGLAWWLLVSAVVYALYANGIELGRAEIALSLVAWAGFVVVGYVQWFRILPWIILKLRTR